MANFQNGEQQVRSSDNVGNLYETTSNNDREYSQGGRLEKKGSWNYKYDADGFLIEKYKASSSIFRSKKDHWQYQWNDAGMLQTVTRPDKEQVHFTYDALGRRLSKTFKSTTTKWLWDGNVPLHEWKENQNGDILSNSTVGDNGIVTWVFEENSFIPTAKLKNNKKFSILADHLGTPTSMHNAEGEQVWERSLDTFGKVITGDNSSCPFMYQGQYYDAEIELAYNRFRYYDPEDGRYISQDPIGLLSGEFNLYNYVGDPNGYIDVFGLLKTVVFPKSKVIADVTIDAQGYRDGDFKAANAEAGINGKRGKPTINAHRNTHGKVTWHHVDYDPETNTMRMQLVTTADHEATLPHEGSAKHFRDHHNLAEYDSEESKRVAKELNEKKKKNSYKK